LFGDQQPIKSHNIQDIEISEIMPFDSFDVALNLAKNL